VSSVCLIFANGNFSGIFLTLSFPLFRKEAISTQDKSMLRKLLDMSDQIRHWNGSRKHRIRSVDSSPIVSQLNLFSVGNKSLGSIPPLLGTSIKSIPEELHLPARTYSMENLYNPKGTIHSENQINSN
jgi:hypothetical protein